MLRRKRKENESERRTRDGLDFVDHNPLCSLRLCILCRRRGCENTDWRMFYRDLRLASTPLSTAPTRHYWRVPPDEVCLSICVCICLSVCLPVHSFCTRYCYFSTVGVCYTTRFTALSPFYDEEIQVSKRPFPTHAPLITEYTISHFYTRVMC